MLKIIEPPARTAILQQFTEKIDRSGRSVPYIMFTRPF